MTSRLGSDIKQMRKPTVQSKTGFLWMLATRLGRAPWTIRRELARNGGRHRYRAHRADGQRYVGLVVPTVETRQTSEAACLSWDGLESALGLVPDRQCDHPTSCGDLLGGRPHRSHASGIPPVAPTTSPIRSRSGSGRADPSGHRADASVTHGWADPLVRGHRRSRCVAGFRRSLRHRASQLATI